jgi:hypothetical protein
MGVAGWQVIQPERALADRLEQGEIVPFLPSPFPLPSQDQLDFLCRQQIGSIGHKNISYNPRTRRASGFVWQSAQQAETLRDILQQFAVAASTWLSETLPAYASAWKPDRVSFRPEEEATRRVRLTARNDLLHIDTFPSRPTQGYRILRLFVNVHPSEPRVWITSDSFASLLGRYGAALGLYRATVGRWAWKMGSQIARLFSADTVERTEYDDFMLRLHHFLKSNEEFQEHARRRFWHFGPGTAWLAFTDGFSHADLRGRYALEHSFFVAPETLALPHLAPSSLFAAARRERRAA